MNIIETKKLIDLLQDIYNSQNTSSITVFTSSFEEIVEKFLTHTKDVLSEKKYLSYMESKGNDLLNRIARQEVRPFVRLVDYRFEMRYLPNPITNKILTTIFADIIKDVPKDANEFIILDINVQNENIKNVLFTIYDTFIRSYYNVRGNSINSKENSDFESSLEKLREFSILETRDWISDYIKYTKKDVIIHKFTTTFMLKETIEYIKKMSNDETKKFDATLAPQIRTISLFSRGLTGLSVVKYLNEPQKYNDKCPNLLVLICYYLSRFNGNLRIAPNVVIHSIPELLTTWNKYLLNSDDSSLNFDILELTEKGKEFMIYQLNTEKYSYAYNELFKRENPDFLVDVFINVVKNKVGLVNKYKNLPVEIIYIIFGYLRKTNNQNIVKSICDDLLEYLNPQKESSTTHTPSSRKVLNDPYVTSLLKRIFNESLLESPQFDFVNLWRPEVDLHLYINEKLADFYRITFISEIKKILSKYYPNYNREELDYDLFNLSELDKKIMYLIKLNWNLIKELPEKEFDNFMYAWIYNKTNLINTNFNSSLILELQNQYINFDYINNAEINPICFVDNNLLSVKDRKVFSEFEYKGDKLYSIIINWLKINCEIKYDLDIKYPSSQFQKDLISSLKFEEIIQTNHLHHGKDESFSVSDYFEAYLWSLYLTHGSHVVYRFVLDLFKQNANDYLLNSEDKSYIDDQWYFDNKYSKQLGIKLPKIYYWKKLDYIKRGYSYSRVRDSLYSRTFEREFNKIINDVFALRQNTNDNNTSLIPLNYLNSKPDYVTSIFFLNKFNILNNKGLEELIDDLKDFKESEKQEDNDFEFEMLD